MTTVVAMPKLGLLMTEGEVVRWLVGDGQPVEQGKPIVNIMTKKINYQVVASTSGVLYHAAQPNDKVLIGEPLAFIAGPGEPAPLIPPPQTPPAPVLPSGLAAATETPDVKPASSRFVLASPAARRLAQQSGIDLSDLHGTGPEGSIVERDVLSFDEQRKAAWTATRVPILDRPQARLLPFAGQRRAIAERLMESVHSMAQVTLHGEADVTRLIWLRKRAAPELGLTDLDVVIKAVAAALRVHPRLNAILLGDEIELLDDIHIGFAVQLDDGLLVPVIREADRRTLTEIAREKRRLLDGARNGSLTVDDVTGSTFTISDLGNYGVDAFTPIINPPEAGILGVGRVFKKPYVSRSKMGHHLCMMLSLSFDHRVLDGAPAAAFLQTVIGLLAKPDSLFA